MTKKRSYDFSALEKKWQAFWKANSAFRAYDDTKKPKYYVLDMFPYPSGQGLHTGHALGYVASDIVARYKRSCGYNVLHPMGFDSFGLPAEQYAQEVGQHPKLTTAANVARYRQQLESLGLYFDWDRTFSTSDPDYYGWTQWLFLLFFETWYDREKGCAMPISSLVERLAQKGNADVHAACTEGTPTITAEEWHHMDEKAQQAFLLHYRLAYLHHSVVNWCPGLGTVLANDEVKDGLSERGGFPVEKKKMQQWSLRITAYADRLLEGLDGLAWSDALKEMQRNWIGRSEGALIHLEVADERAEEDIVTFSTLPETIFGITYVILAPEHPYVQKFIAWQAEGDAAQQKRAHDLRQYKQAAAHLSERERMKKAEHASGLFTGFYAKNPFTQEHVPIWIGDYVLEGYGTGAVMGVPAHDARDKAFAQHFSLPIVQVIDGKEEETQGKNAKGTMINSSFLNGMQVQQARPHIIEALEKRGIGKRKVQYRLRDAVFSRQRYWGEPFPIYYKEGVPYPMDPAQLPLCLPEIDDYKPTAEGAPPLARAKNWTTPEGNAIEYNTMPGWAGSSWYFFRYMDAHNTKAFASKASLDYWKEVDLYIGGTEHATGHLLYARFFTKILHDLGYVSIEEPFKQLINQGMIQATSHFVYRIKGTNQFVSHGQKEAYDTTALRVHHQLVHKKVLDLEAFKKWRSDFSDATFILENGQYICGQEIEKMSKSKHNGINPDDVMAQYGADTFRLYMMFLGPLTQSKPWSTQGIEGIARFMQKVWKLFHSQTPDTLYATHEPPSQEAERAIHTAIKHVTHSLERYAFNTAVSALMICANTLLEENCTSKKVLDDYVRLLAPFAPHLGEELWQRLGHTTSILEAPMPRYDPAKLTSSTESYPVAINGKKRAEITVPTASSRETIEKEALAEPSLQKWIADKTIVKVIVIPQRMVNIVVQ